MYWGSTGAVRYASHCCRRRPAPIHLLSGWLSCLAADKRHMGAVQQSVVMAATSWVIILPDRFTFAPSSRRPGAAVYSVLPGRYL